MIARVYPETECPAQKPIISHADICRLRDLLRLHNFKSGQLDTFSRSNSERQFVYEAHRHGQDDFLVAILPDAPQDRKEAVELLHRVRGKEPPSQEKLEGLAEKGYMLIKEPEVAQALRQYVRSISGQQSTVTSR